LNPDILNRYFPLVRPVILHACMHDCRSWMDVIECILEKTIGGSEKVHVMHQCNLITNKFQVYLDFLLSEGFIREVEQSIETTEKGLSFLKDYRNLKRVIK